MTCQWFYLKKNLQESKIKCFKAFSLDNKVSKFRFVTLKFVWWIFRIFSDFPIIIYIFLNYKKIRDFYNTVFPKKFKIFVQIFRTSQKKFLNFLRTLNFFKNIEKISYSKNMEKFTEKSTFSLVIFFFLKVWRTEWVPSLHRPGKNVILREIRHSGGLQWDAEAVPQRSPAFGDHFQGSRVRADQG